MKLGMALSIALAVEQQRVEDQYGLYRELIKYRANEKDREIHSRMLRELIMKYSSAERGLKELNDLKNRFLGIAAHDLRNPLVSIRGFSEIMLEGETGPLTDDQREFLTIINSASQSMLALVNDLLDVSVIESGKLDLRKTVQSLGTLILDRIRLQEIPARQKNISIRPELDDVPDFPFDSERMAQVVDNLVSNAVKFSPPGSEILVRMGQDGDDVRCAVVDHGPGVSPEDRTKLFGAFQRLSARPTGGEKSTGLGLSIVKKIVEAHDGVIDVISEPGTGSEFYFSIPGGR
jgi:two-component system sensor histidine kinase/response regulator